ncbi:hypothetical protein [Salinisphaera aquimarina]|uniref:Porin n=1 Tax=Salinisphaera aquimarina TaxID=2094031 RepID=A0ABV7EU40_9GAMM
MIKYRTAGRALVSGALIWGTSSLALAQMTDPSIDAAPNSDSPANLQTSAPAATPGDKLFGSFGIDYASHFVSYGGDVWGGGNDFYGTQATNFAHVDLGAELPSGFAVTFGVWSDINNNADDTLGGNIQEIDIYGGLSYTINALTLGVTYQQWYYGGEVERIVDLSAGYDDSALWGDSGFALNPAFVTHIRVKGQPGQDEGAVFVGSVEPAFPLVDSPTWPITLSIPTSVGFMTDDFQGGDGGFGYASLGATATIGLSAIPVSYGEWSLAFNTTYYHTDEDVIPGNPEDDFLTGMVSLAMAF